MGTQNDINAKFYDIIYSQVKDDVETDGEIALVSSLGTRGSSVLDIGCGSGRHAMKLSEKGFDVVGIDNSLAMLSEARKKSSNTNITFVHKDILSFESSKHFDLICSFWNGINEIALTYELLEKFFRKANTLLAGSGKLLINTEDLKLFDPSHASFTLSFPGGNLSWNVETCDEKTRTTTSREEVRLDDGNVSTAHIVQKWWTEDELESVASSCGLQMEIRTIPENEELYLIFTPVDPIQ